MYRTFPFVNDRESHKMAFEIHVTYQWLWLTNSGPRRRGLGINIADAEPAAYTNHHAIFIRGRVMIRRNLRGLSNIRTLCVDQMSFGCKFYVETQWLDHLTKA